MDPFRWLKKAGVEEVWFCLDPNIAPRVPDGLLNGAQGRKLAALPNMCTAVEDSKMGNCFNGNVRMLRAKRMLVAEASKNWYSRAAK
jgi:hypothetical protein